MMIFLKRISKFGVSGGVSAISNIVILFILSNFIGLWYLTASVISFIISSLLNFYMQKKWVFGDNNHDHIDVVRQMMYFYIMAIINIIINIALMYAFVDYFGIYYILAQAITLIILASLNFFCYGRFIFKKNE